MYTHYFGLKEKPFSISPDPKYLYMSDFHREAIAHLVYGIENNGCIILLTGEVGTGKTTVCRSILTQLPESTDIALIFNPILSSDELLVEICKELQVPEDNGQETIKNNIARLNAYLLDSHSKGKKTVVIIDEAQNLDPEVLEQLRLLTNLETDDQKLLTIVLIGQPELKELLRHETLRQINQRVTSRYHLKGLKQTDIVKYIARRIMIAGGENRNLFTKKSLKILHKHSQGIPRLINLICDRALLGAYAVNTHIVDRKIMKTAAYECLDIYRVKGSKISHYLGRITLPAALLFCIIIILILLFPDLRNKIQNNLGQIISSNFTPTAYETSAKHPEKEIGVQLINIQRSMKSQTLERHNSRQKKIFCSFIC